MRLFVLHVVAVALFAAPAGAQQAQDEVRDLLEKAIKAQGGEALLSKHQAGTIKAKGTIEIAGAVPIEQTISYQLPNKFRDESMLNINGMEIRTVAVFDGKKGGIEVNGKKVDLGDKVDDALRNAAQLLPMSKLVPLRDKSFELSSAGEVQVNGKPAVGIRAVKKGQPDVTMYFGKSNYLLVKIEYRTVDIMSGQEVTEERIITEYKTVDGIPQPAKVLLNRDGKKLLEAEILEVRSLEKLDDGIFTVP
jgi:hypothetical protein